MMPRVQHVIEQEKVEVTEDGMQALVTLAKGDMRKALNILQIFENIGEFFFLICILSFIHIVPLSFLLDTHKLKTVKGLALQDVVTEVHTYVHRIEFPKNVRIHLLEKMADIIEHRIAAGTSEKIQLGSLVAAFQIARDMVMDES
ncbi:hypothetical protein BSL78_04107 [Apostichopus japonicus]|uniref:Replication factor C C-terminal domain-containing protein n=1 Tax=Stichopus japonicus TaxID=307972 RepID=A0A2G8LFJ3_STIJA|nr:hypothetical protein BSL78_04107 [Apostichopus japonicus]